MAYTLPKANSLTDSMAAARLAGHSWSDINSFVTDKMDQSKRGAGYSHENVHDYLGLGSPSLLNERLTGVLRQNMANPEGQDAGQ